MGFNMYRTVPQEKSQEQRLSHRVGMGRSYIQLPDWELKKLIGMIGAAKLEQRKTQYTENTED